MCSLSYYWHMITVKALGGCGEDARNCFYVDDERYHILLDCGVKREIASVETVYPALSRDMAASLDAVLLSHAHEDHSAGLPYLYELGYRGPIYASRPTIALARGFMRKWVSYVKDNGGALPFDEANIDCLDFQDIEKAMNLGIRSGRSAHMLGSLWFFLEPSRILYTGDLCLDSLLLAHDELPKCDVLVVDSAYASRKIDQAKQYKALEASAIKTLERGGKILLPVPVNGRGIDMMLYLRSCGLGLDVQASIMDNAQALYRETAWIKPSPLWSELENHKKDSRIIIRGDGMMTSKSAMESYDALKGSSANTVVLTGHMANGTLGEKVLDHKLEDPIEVDEITIKVHPDCYDVIKTVQSCEPKAVMLFHSLESQALCSEIEALGIKATCTALGQLIL